MSEAESTERKSIIVIGDQVVQQFTGPLSKSGQVLSITDVFFTKNDDASPHSSDPMLFSDTDEILPDGCIVKLCRMMREQQQKAQGLEFIHAEVREYTEPSDK